jgi:hypothetical protein
MKLSIPAQNPPNTASSPASPRNLKKVLSELPHSNMGELTKQTFQILRDQNRQTIPSKDRLDNLEMIGEISRSIFDSLKKYFINRTLPLPEKSKKIVYLNQSLLQELVYGYEIIAHESFHKTDESINDKTLSAAICQAINYLTEILLRASEVYQPCPKNLWYDAHQLYLYAESKGITDNNVYDKDSTANTTITKSYKRILLFALARPTTLRQSDCDRVFKKLFEWSEYTTIEQHAPENLVDCIFSMRVFEDKAPGYLSKKEITGGINIRTLNTCKLVSHIENLVAEKQRLSQKLTVGDELPMETLMALLRTWGHNSDRRFSRAERHGHINVAIGLSNICKAIHESKKLQDELPEIDDDLHRPLSHSDNLLVGSNHEFFNVSSGSNDNQNLTLESIADEKRQQGYMTIGDDDENQWDMVAKGRVITDAYEKDKQLIDNEQLEKKRSESDSHWEIVNTSPGGYCLRWDSDDTSTAQIGELIALQEFDAANNFNWHVGTVRWMQFSQENGLEIGIQILSPKVETASVQRVNRLDEAPFDCLIMPEIKALNQETSIILPAHAFKPDNKLVVRHQHSIICATLLRTKEHTGSFTQFNYKSAGLDRNIQQQIKKEALNLKDGFDEIWPTI